MTTLPIDLPAPGSEAAEALEALRLALERAAPHMPRLSQTLPCPVVFGKWTLGRLPDRPRVHVRRIADPHDFDDLDSELDEMAARNVMHGYSNNVMYADFEERVAAKLALGYQPSSLHRVVTIMQIGKPVRRETIMKLIDAFPRPVGRIIDDRFPNPVWISAFQASQRYESHRASVQALLESLAGPRGASCDLRDFARLLHRPHTYSEDFVAAENRHSAWKVLALIPPERDKDQKSRGPQKMAGVQGVLGKLLLSMWVTTLLD